MRLNRVNERRGNGNNPLILIAAGAIAIILLVIGGYFVFGNGSDEPSSHSELSTADELATLIPTPVDPTLNPTRIPTAIPTPIPTELPTPIPTELPTVIPTATATATATVPPTPVPTINITKSPLPEVVNDNPPHVFVGTVTIDGELAPDGTTVSAWMLQYSEPVGSSMVPSVLDQPGSYSLLIPQYGTNFNGTVLRIRVDGNFVTNAVWMSGEATQLDLVP